METAQQNAKEFEKYLTRFVNQFLKVPGKPRRMGPKGETVLWKKYQIHFYDDGRAIIKSGNFVLLQPSPGHWRNWHLATYLLNSYAHDVFCKLGE